MGKELGAKSQEAVGPNLALAVQWHRSTKKHNNSLRYRCHYATNAIAKIPAGNYRNMVLLQYCFKVLLLRYLVQIARWAKEQRLAGKTPGHVSGVAPIIQPVAGHGRSPSDRSYTTMILAGSLHAPMTPLRPHVRTRTHTTHPRYQMPGYGFIAILF